ncbi:hypothetical protein L6164_036616 [Bauhinia variegata]|uniref:Uncharacterized protein n=1 Tax=Bauhinia variegata TaxID=167791 RepID=A0ACB9KHS4_BAUVA|nr:hypothetical protein L6164_036616 [Bauhinia variegata]
MASFSPMLPSVNKPSPSSTHTISTSSSFPIFKRDSLTFLHRNPNNYHVSRVGCSSKDQLEIITQSHLRVFQRRNILLGLGGIFTAATSLTSNNPFSLAAETAEETHFPLVLSSKKSITVKRPKKSKTKEEKEQEEEVLVIEGIEFDGNSQVKFDVHINDEHDNPSKPDKAEFAASFVSLPRGSKGHKKKKTNLRVGISELLEDLRADQDENVRVTLVPKTGKVIIGNVKVELTKF